MFVRSLSGNHSSQRFASIMATYLALLTTAAASLCLPFLPNMLRSTDTWTAQRDACCSQYREDRQAIYPIRDTWRLIASERSAQVFFVATWGLATGVPMLHMSG